MKSQAHATSYRSNPDWRQLGRCREVINAPDFDPEHDPFFPEQGGSSRAARAICAQCPIVVRHACLEFALSHPGTQDFGIWGGTGSRERAKIRAERRLAEPVVLTGKGRHRGTAYVPAQPLQDALKALVGPVYRSQMELSRTLGPRAGLSPIAIEKFLSKLDKRTVTLAWATKVMIAAGFDPAAVYPESEAA